MAAMQTPPEEEEVIIGPQEGPQEMFLSSEADITIFGGAAGAGKSLGLLLEPLRNATDNPGFNCVIFRRNTVQVRNPGGLWDESMKLYPLADGTPVSQPLEWRWAPEGGLVKFSHLEHESTVNDWQGSQICLIGFDELTHFSRAQFFYMLSRNRSMCGVRPYVRATCNPDADSWVAEFISWWIDQDTGFFIPERRGVLRWFIRIGDKVIWADTRQELVDEYSDPSLPEDDPEQPLPKSVTFIGATIYDNKKLLKADPGYLANLKALPLVERARLLGGNWKIRPAAGLYFKREWVEVVDTLPADLLWVRYWDLAATEKIPENDPDWTVSTKMGWSPRTKMYYVAHVSDMQASPAKVEAAMLNTATADGREVRIGIPQDPGQAGKAQVRYTVTQLSKFNVSHRSERGDKTIRFGPFSAQCEVGNVKVLRGAWNERWFTALEGFPDAPHDDHADSAAGAFSMFTDNAFGLLDFYSQQAAQATKENQS